MLRFTRGNLLEADAEAIVNTVNCVGVMGKGIALQFKQAFPKNYHAYAAACKRGEVKPGAMFTFATGSLVNPKFVINFPTKRHWRGKSKIEDIERGLAALVEEVRRLRIRSIAIPPLGCGNGGLDWNMVRPLIESALAQVPDVETLIFEPAGAPEPRQMPVATKPPRMTRARALLVRLLQQYAIPMYELTLLEVQKLAYFLQVAGEPMQLNYVKHKYGPYAENLNFVLQHIEGHFIRGYGDRSREANITLLPGAVEQADAVLAHDEDASERLQRVSKLIEGFETPYGMELLASVHWVCAAESPPARGADQAIERVMGWNAHKKLSLKPTHIRKAWQRLNEQGWLG